MDKGFRRIEELSEVEEMEKVIQEKLMEGVNTPQGLVEIIDHLYYSEDIPKWLLSARCCCSGRKEEFIEIAGFIPALRNEIIVFSSERFHNELKPFNNAMEIAEFAKKINDEYWGIRDGIERLMKLQPEDEKTKK